MSGLRIIIPAVMATRDNKKIMNLVSCAESHTLQKYSSASVVGVCSHRERNQTVYQNTFFGDSFSAY